MPKANSDQLQAFANELSACLEEAGITRRQVAAALGVTSQAVDYWATGKREPDLRMVAALEEFLGAQGRLIACLGYQPGVVQSRRRFRLEPKPEDAEPEIHIAASGVDLDELRLRDPDAYELILAQAKMALDRARDRHGR